MPRFEPHPTRRPALIAGASSGIGAATAVALAELGHPVALGARRVELCEELAGKIRADGGDALAHRLDVTDADSVDAFVTAAEDALGPAEILVSGAGDIEFALVQDMDPESFLRQVHVHLVGAQRLVHRVLPGMLARKRGDLVLIGSDCAPQPRPRTGAYTAAKAGLEAMATQLRMELEGTGIRSSVVRPGPTLTNMGMNSTPEVVGPLLEDWQRWGFARHPYMLRASDLAAAVVAVVSAPRGAHLVLVEVQPEAPLK
ncbi:SDR family oxidoreductase [Nocardia puris]|uniref:NADP-dependent 3-hydroxy acid dehydrogenase YdfG n=1 Tax=Nocardia puris TaxID=208602 RepID=A0A366DR53_9NOCA|nr:SDR family oxidoreductase [Nocardia puris]MBF6210951.1 SDR family oxidoreductase [Nocardia puris]MBF6364547.1 SDR family oxidoreductase [Nocardia puris]MBF6459476.1 SDR family oxidoreductase [Nocardia puris]RBO92562.1 NADP-dependent 3-hydroxy acid dehydrogenase YdfG [Nocardia puris]